MRLHAKHVKHACRVIRMGTSMSRIFWFSLVELQYSLEAMMEVLISLSMGQRKLVLIEYIKMEKETCEVWLVVKKHKTLQLKDFRKSLWRQIFIYVVDQDQIGGFVVGLWSCSHAKEEERERQRVVGCGGSMDVVSS